MQLAAADIILIAAVIAPELWSYNCRSWRFGLAGCIAYKGIDIFASTASLYLVATVAFHSLATLNLEEKEILRRIKRNNEADDAEVRSSRHSLVANSDSSTPPRSMHIDYRLVDTRVPVAPPTIFVWVLAASLSVPQFTLSTLRQEDSIISCTLMDSSHRINIYTMLAIFNLLLPSLIFCAIIVLTAAKLKSVKRLAEIKNGETVAAVKLSQWLIAVFSVFCAPRSVFSIYRMYSVGNDEEPMAVSTVISSLSIAFSSAYLIATLVRPILCLMLLPRLRRIFTVGGTLDVDIL